MTTAAVGRRWSESVSVDESNVASAVGSGMVDVFATPMMVALVERAASNCIRDTLGPGQVSVGAHIGLEHVGATPKGMSVTATATVTAVDGRRVEFAVVVTDGAGEVGRGGHTRFVVDRERFMAKAEAKKG